MIKSELIKKISNKLTDIPERDISLSVNLILNYMGQALSTGQRVEVRGFGSFNLHYHAPRQAHNPKTGTKVITDAKYSPHFKPGKELKERIDSSKIIFPIKDDDDDADDFF